MYKKEIKNLLMSMRTSENEKTVNSLLGKIDLLSDEKLESIISKIGNTEDNIKNYLHSKLEKTQNHTHEEHTPINEMFTYGIANNTIHLHMPVDLHQMISEIGISKTVATVNLFLLDAIEKIRKMQNDGYYKFNNKKSIYMISPILVGSEIKFLNELDFTTQTYKKTDLQNPEFVSLNPEAQLATHIFGTNKNVGTAKIDMNVINSNEWQEKRKIQVKEFEKKGITINKNNKCIEK